MCSMRVMRSLNSNDVIRCSVCNNKPIGQHKYRCREEGEQVVVVFWKTKENEGYVRGKLLDAIYHEIPHHVNF